MLLIEQLLEPICKNDIGIVKPAVLLVKMVILVMRVLIFIVNLVVALSTVLLVIGLFVLKFILRSLHVRSVIQLVVCFILVGLGM